MLENICKLLAIRIGGKIFARFLYFDWHGAFGSDLTSYTRGGGLCYVIVKWRQITW